MALKYGAVREDGRMYYGKQRGKELWVTPENYAKRLEARRKYQRKCRAAFKERQNRKNEMDHNYYGKYDFSRNLYFIGLTSSGKEIWGSKDQLEKDREIQLRSARNYRKRCRELHPPISVKIGSPHPTKPGLFCVRKTGNKAFWGDKKELERRMAYIMQSRRKRQFTLRRRRKELNQRLGQTRIARGTVGEDGRVFYCYNPAGMEYWVSAEQYAAMIERRRELYRLSRDKKAEKANHS